MTLADTIARAAASYAEKLNAEETRLRDQIYEDHCRAEAVAAGRIDEDGRKTYWMYRDLRG